MAFTLKQIKANRRAWIRALRSGKYEQTTGCLAKKQGDYYNVAGYCCLGVACEVLVKRGAIAGYVGGNDSLSIGARRALGLETRCGGFDSAVATRGRPDNRAYDLTQINDILGWSFKKIASFIEKEPGGLFIEDSNE